MHREYKSKPGGGGGRAHPNNRPKGRAATPQGAGGSPRPDPINIKNKNQRIMRKSLEEMIETSFDVKCHLQVGSYELHHYDDGSYTDFKTPKINDLSTLLAITRGLEVRLFSQDGSIVVRVFEDFKEY